VHDDVTGYEESLWAPASWWALAAGAVVTVWWAFLVAAPAWWAWTAAAVAGVVVFGSLLRYSRVRVSARPDGLHAGRARLAWAYVGSVDVLDADRVRTVLGVSADARAHLLVRTYCRGAVKVAVDDDRDPTPYWVISTRDPENLAAHLRRFAGSGGAPLGTQHT
jgi:hypothetical protein